MGRRIFLVIFLAAVVAIASLSYFSRRSRDAAEKGTTGSVEDDAQTVILQVPDGAGAGPSSMPASGDSGR